MAVSHLQSERKRAAVFGYRLMFSPETQPIKQTVISQILFIQLAESTNKKGESVGNLNSLTVNGVNILTLSLNETRDALNRLVEEGLVEQLSVRKKARWIMTEKGRQRIEKDRGTAERQIDSVVDNLFRGCSLLDEYRTAFLECLTGIFGRLAREYVEVSFPDVGGIDGIQELSALAAGGVKAVAQEVLDKFPRLDAGQFSSGLQRFFSEDHPDSNWLKWTYCKNYYSLKIIGLGKHADALSKEVFSGTSAYLDTNVLIDLLDSSSSSHTAMTQTIAKLRDVGCDVEVLSVTVHELRDFVRNQGHKLDAVLRQIPDELLTQVPGLVARAEASHRNDPSKPSPRDVLGDLENADDVIKNRLQAAVVEDEWFEEERDSEKIETLAQELRQHYDRTPPPWRQKTQKAAKHDALSLQFVSERKREGKNCMFVTLDRSLPTFRHSTIASNLTRFNNVISVDALLPWLGMVSQDDNEVSRAYSSLLSNQLVSMKQTLSIQEFRMLAEIGMDCGKMPAEDVEQCILYLRGEAKGSDLGKAEDREKLHHKVRTFFSSPDRKYLSEISGLRQELGEINKTLEQVSKASKQEAARYREKIDDHEHRVRTARVKQRLTLVAAFFSIGLIGWLWLANSFSTGDNMLQKIGNTWWLFGILVSASFCLMRTLCAGELWPDAKRILAFFRSN